ncbi:Succinoglycan biosynthesis protein ExoI [Roseovarius albus]|uniref:Succinoglycan biosynthesis protein ExoI n=1 Tax=Roseovarius albus TaxID=1247867 RepID=A0A1X7AAJ2_9RHOB|nr:thermonuclease family protein [Roseovarius albus]SLN74305.1 Succinoglycan biosynthesis protein ExoI [Roseovarius albus]
MEIAIILILALVGVLIFVNRHSQSGGNRTLPNQKVSDGKPSLTTSLAPRKEQSPRFDADNAIPAPIATVLKGSAYVVDGDTIVIQKTQVRLFGVDAPEINHPYGKKAKWALVSLCKGHAVKAEITAKDNHGRTVAKCYLEDGRDLSAEMVKLGLAIDWQKYSGGVYRALELPGARKKLWLADARQKGRMKVWEQYDAKQTALNQKQ